MAGFKIDPLIKSFREMPLQCLHFLMPEASHPVVIYHSHCLHESIDDRASDEFETSFFEVLAHGIGFRAGGGKIFHALTVVCNWAAAHK